MSSFDDAKTKHAKRAVTAIAASHGLTFDRLELIGGYSNTILRLSPLPLVARVATSTVRSGTAWLTREIEVARFLASTKALAARPSDLLPPGPHEREGLAVSFWQFLQIEARPPSPTEAGRSLRSLHEALAPYSAYLPRMSAMVEAMRILSDPTTPQPGGEDSAVIARSMSRVTKNLADRNLACRVLHGDAHYGNLWRVGGDLIWGDFEDTHSGPKEWDLACLASSSRVLGSGAAAREALLAYGEPFDEDLLKLLIEARTLQAIAWGLVSLKNPISNSRLRARLDWLAQQ